ncbi:G protein-coupled receptor rhodopsin-like, partial [Trinorchestia longiramus]
STLNVELRNFSREELELRELRENVYPVMIPVLVAFLLVSALTSLTILLSVPFLKRPISPIVRLSFSHNTANAAFSIVVAISIMVQSYMPFVLGIDIHDCIQLSLEAVRLGTIVVQVYHLLAVACIHYYGCVRPIHYNATVTPGRVKTIIALLWAVPNLCLFVGFASIPGQGFQAPGCTDVYFYFHVNFRVVTMTVIVTPMLLLTIIYCMIFRLLRERGMEVVSGEQRAQQRRRKTMTTSLLIVGTFAIGWLPASVSYVLLCDSCLIPNAPITVRMAVHTASYILFIIKVFVDTFIYVVGLHDIRKAMKCLFTQIKLCCGVNKNAREGLALHTSTPTNTTLLNNLSYRRTQRQRDGTTET